MSKSLLRQALGGTGAGVAATVPMSLLMLLARRAGLMGTHPPKAIVEKAGHVMDARPDEDSENALAAVMHFAFGGGTGAGYALVREAVPDRVPDVPLGLATGAAVWAVSYAGWVPALSVLPAPHRDRADRQLVMLVAHLVYGGALAKVYPALRRR